MASVCICSLCGADTPSALAFSIDQHACARCARQLGLLLQEDARLATVWPVLSEADDDEPEPMVQLSDGRRVELRSRTEELKRELTVDQRAQLAESYVELSLYKEAVQEAAVVLASGEAAPSERALCLLFRAPLAAPDAPERLRPFLLPV